MIEKNDIFVLHRLERNYRAMGAGVEEGERGRKTVIYFTDSSKRFAYQKKQTMQD